MTIPAKFDKYDHGYVDINKHRLAYKGFEIVEEVVFNALNIFKVLKVESTGEYNMIYIEYGPIFGLLSKDKKELSSNEKEILINYQHCAHFLSEIEDEGDVLLLANEYEKSKEYYNGKLK